MCVSELDPLGSATPTGEALYISRLEAVQKAIDKQLQGFSQSVTQGYRVAIIAFSNDVIIMRRGATNPSRIVTEGHLYEFESLLEIGEIEGHGSFANPALELDDLRSKLLGLSARGQTALGPALLVAMGMAGSSNAGGHVIVCTDGLSNVGVGALSVSPDKLELSYSQAFFARATEYAHLI